MKTKKSKRMFAAYHPKSGINSYWVRVRAKTIRGETESERQLWKGAVKRGWRIVPVIVTLEKKAKP